MIHIVYRLFLLFILPAGLLSCVENGRLTNNNSPTLLAPPSIDMANPRGLNMDLMNIQIAQLIEDTRVIQDRVKTLLTELTEIRNELAYYNPASYQQTVEIAGKERQITLPVPERPKLIKKQNSVSITPPVFVPSKNINIKNKPNNVTITGVTDIRTGIHYDKTRIVLDINGSTSHTVDFDKSAGIITIELAEAQWNTIQSKNYQLPQLDGYQAKNLNDRAIMAISVKNTKSVKTSSIKKTGNKPARLIIDLIK